MSGLTTARAGSPVVLPRGLAAITAEAVTPEQVVPYVLAVADVKPAPCGGGVAYLHDGRLVLVAYPPADVSEAVARALTDFPDLREITVLAPERPRIAPPEASVVSDQYWTLPLPPLAPGQKLRNMLARARRELRFSWETGEMGEAEEEQGASAWSREHSALVEAFIRSRPLAPGTVHIFRHLQAYLEQVPGALLLSARSGAGGLQGFCIGDFSSLATVFYMFAFRHPESPPGTADALLAGLLEEGARRGHRRINLGLGINPGIVFFKQKWQAQATLPYVETTWSPARKSWWRSWF